MSLWTGAVNNDWNNAGNWTSDGVSTGIPDSTKDAIFNASSTVLCTTGNAGVGQRNCRDLITTGHTGTLQIGSGTNGDLRVWRNVTIGGTVITGSSYLSMHSNVASTTLNVQVGNTIPNFKSESQVATSTITLSNTTVVTNYFKSEALSGANVVFSAASAVELRISNIAGHTRTTTMGTNTTMRLMGGTFVNCTLSGAIVLNTGATLTGTGTSGAELVFSGITSFNASAGTIVLPAISNTYRLGTGIGLAQGTLTLNMGTNELDYFYVTTANVGQAFLILQSDLIANKGFHTQFYGVRVTPNGFNIITKESVSAGNIGFSTSAKISFKGVPSASGFLGMGYISGSTLILTSVTTGSLAKGQVIHFPTVAGAASYNVILSCTTFNSSYGLQFSPQTVGSVGSPVPIYGYGGMTGVIGQETGFLNCLFEVDASSNDTYFLGFNLYTLAGEFRYLSTNTGAFDGSKGAITAASNGANGIIDFQGQSSPTKFINTISLPNFFSQLTLKSNLYVNDHIGAGDSGILQSGSSYTLYVMRNFTASVATTTRAYQPTIELIGSTAANFTCGTLLGNVVINKSGGATVTVTQSFIYGYATPTTFTYTAGLVNFGATTMTIGGNVTINNPLSIGNFSFNNVTLSNNASVTIQNVMNILGSLLCSGSATFAGTHGWTTNGFTCTTASAVITLQNADATYGSPLAAYNVTGPLILQGTSTTTRITLQASGRANFTGSIATASLPATSVMTVASLTSGTIRAGMTVSQASGIIPTGLQPFINDRPVINSGGGSSWTLNKALSTVVPFPSGTTTLAAGFKAIFNLTSTGTNVNVGLVITQDIDSSGGLTILAAISNGDDTATNTALYRTLNWGPLIAPSGSVYYTWVD